VLGDQADRQGIRRGGVRACVGAHRGDQAATIGLLTNMSLTPDGAFDKPLSTKQVLAKAGPLIKK
jgi:hypothetical protein